MAGGELLGVRLRTLTFAFLAAAVVLVGVIGPATASNDPRFADQWNLLQIGAPAAWARSTGANVKIGIVDSGVFATQEDLAGKIVASTNCVGSNGNPSACSGGGADNNGHGTHVAGIAAAFKDNGRGIAGVAPDAQLVVAKALEDDNHGAPSNQEQGASGSESDINAAIMWAVDHGARVINLSLGGNFVVTNLFGTSIVDGIEYAWNHGAVPVIAAGNDNLLGLGSQQYGSMHALVVGATDPSGGNASYSSPIGNAQWGLVAPGGAGTGKPNDVLSTWWNRNDPGPTNYYAYAAGTSMATPHVSGAVALLLAQGLGPQAAVDRILSTAAKVPCGSGCHGRLDVAAAVGLAPTPVGASPSGGGATPSAGGGGGSKTVKPNTATTVRPGGAAATSPATDGSTTTGSPSSTDAVPGDNPVVAAGRLPGQQHGGGGGSSGRALQVGAAIALLGGAGLGVGFLFRLRGGAAP